MSIASGANEWVERLAVVALEMTSRNAGEPRPNTPEQAAALLDAVVTRLAERGISTRRDVLYVPFPRVETTPGWGVSGSCPLAITVDLERGPRRPRQRRGHRLTPPSLGSVGESRRV
jgi:hypothetical protein